MGVFGWSTRYTLISTVRCISKLHSSTDCFCQQAALVSSFCKSAAYVSEHRTPISNLSNQQATLLPCWQARRDWVSKQCMPLMCTHHLAYTLLTVANIARQIASYLPSDGCVSAACTHPSARQISGCFVCLLHNLLGPMVPSKAGIRSYKL